MRFSVSLNDSLLRKTISFCSAAVLLTATLTGCSGSGSEGSAPAAQERIINGVVIDPAQLPYVKQMYAVDSFTNLVSTCSGTMINPYQYLTAGHCVHVGESPRLAAPEELFLLMEDGSFNRATAVAPHPNYVHGYFQYVDENGVIPHFPYDAAIITFERPYYGALGVLSSYTPGVGTPTLITGYGRFDPNTQATDGQLRVGQSSVDGISVDLNLYVSAFFDYSESGVCHGDSGGPSLMSLDPAWPLLVIGVNSAVSNGICAPPTYNSHTLIATEEMLSWVLEETQNQVYIQY
jgi:hypothetical protein